MALAIEFYGSCIFADGDAYAVCSTLKPVTIDAKNKSFWSEHVRAGRGCRRFINSSFGWKCLFAFHSARHVQVNKGDDKLFEGREKMYLYRRCVSLSFRQRKSAWPITSVIIDVQTKRRYRPNLRPTWYDGYVTGRQIAGYKSSAPGPCPEECQDVMKHSNILLEIHHS